MPCGSRRPYGDSPIELLEDQAKERLPELGPIRYGRMLESPFTFFRGAAYLMAADLADGTRTGLHAQLCGDAHLSNFGVFRALDRRLVFSINDFDETLPGPFEWDVKRLAASIAVAARDRGFDEATRCFAVLATVRGYREAMARFATMRSVDVWYTRLDVEAIVRAVQEGGQGQGPDTVSNARSQSRRQRTACERLRSCVRWLTASRGSSRDPPLITPIEDVLPGAEQAAPRKGYPEHDRHLPGNASGRPATTARAIPLCTRCP